MPKIIRQPCEVVRCLVALQEELTQVLKIVAERKEDVTIELPGSVPADRRISAPCKPGTSKEDVQRTLAEVFIAVSKAVARKPRRK